MSRKHNADKANVMIFAPERVGLGEAALRIEEQSYNISFEPLDTPRRFDEYDGIVVFQRTFEDFEYVGGDWHSGWRQEVLTDHLDRRHKEAERLLDKGGFICFVLHAPLVDRDGKQNFQTTDLVKRFLPYAQFREDLGSRLVNVDASINEFDRFLKLFGAANTRFQFTNEAIEKLDIRYLARKGRDVVGMVFGDQVLFVPSILPQWKAANLEEYFELLVDASLATLKKLQVEVPKWVEELRFEEEQDLAAKRKELSDSITTIDKRIELLRRMKRVLISDNAALVADVAFVFEKGLGLQVETIEEFKEDLQVLSDDRAGVLILCEIKGVNRGVKREHINQADSHRERRNLAADFPTLLIVNTGIKSSKNLEEKDQAIDREQVRHAMRNHILILRTLDLLYLAQLRAAGKIESQAVRNLLLTSAGWLKANPDGVSIQTN